MKAPFPWFGGKRRVAPIVWDALGDVDNYVEPFAGSLAVLLERPSRHTGGAETVNDRDAYLANVWRAIALAPDEVARWADWPVNETDLFARHLWLVNEGRARIATLESDPDAYDAKVAGWWLWGICAWIGSGWCAGNGPHHHKRPHLSNSGRGVNRKRPHLGDSGQGINRQLPHLGNSGQGINRREIDGYMRALQARLRRVRVCCGDWSRVVTRGAMSYGATVGVFLDPPYSTEERTGGLYRDDDDTTALSRDVREWAIANGDDKRLRIALCGYEGEHAMPPTWRVHEWASTGAYMGGGENTTSDANRKRERIWLSPGCLQAQRGLFDRMEAA